MKPLGGVRVLEVAGWLAAPGAGAIMADMGADVIKVEPPTGDTMRGKMSFANVEGPRGDVDYVFQLDNRGKRSVAIAMGTPDGAALVQRIAADCDVLLTNLLPARQVRFGLDPESMFELCEGLVHATLTGYGTVGEKADSPGFDLTSFFAHAGPASLIPGPDGPARFRNGQGDQTTSLALFGAVLAALRVRDATGENQRVEVSLMHTGAWTVGADYADILINGRQPKPRGRTEQIAATNNSYPDSNGDWLQIVMPNSDENWAKMCTAIGQELLITDEWAATGSARYRNMPALIETLDATFRTQTREHWGIRFDEHDVIWAPINDLPDAIADPQMRAAGVFAAIDHPVAGTFETLNSPMTIADADIAVRGPAPEIGQHTDEVLSEFGVTPDQITAFRNTAAIT